MSTIIAGRFELQDMVEDARHQLLRAGFSEEQVTSFFINPPGQHALYPVGGDENDSPGAEHTKRGLAQGGLTGGVVGAVAGAATTPVLGPLGPVAGALLGAHVGDLAGAFREMDDNGAQTDVEQLPFRRSGMMVAVATYNAEEEHRAINVLRSLQAQDIEKAQGTIANGDWADFDPLRPPKLVERTMRARP